MTKVGLGHGMVRSLQNYASSFNISAMAEFAMDVPNKRHYIEETANITVKTKFIYKCYRHTHRKQQKLEL